VARALRPELPGLADEIIAAIRDGVPEYARPLEGPFGQGIRVGVEEALRQFVAMVEEPVAGRGSGRDVYVNLGRGEMRAGRGLDALLAAYRLGARVAWRRLSAAGEAAGLRPRTLYLLAESIFAYIDEISADSAEGYAREQAAAAGEAQRRRRALARLLVQVPPPDPAAVQDAAAAAAWRLPRMLAAVAADDDAERLARRLGAEALAVPAGAPGERAVVLLPDPRAPGRDAQLEAAVSRPPLALGPTVGWDEAAISSARALRCLMLVEEGALSADGSVVRAEEHGLDLVLAADRRLARDLSASALAPLDGVRATSRDRLAATLREWLRHRGRTEQVARVLHVHPQTVRYRMARVRELFGDALEDPDRRLELEMALRVRRGGAG
jgi:DNA-binding PucR family transcriptional regulator